jgi:phospholipase C
MGVPTVCIPDPATHGCVKPFHGSDDVEYGGPHTAPASRKDINGGRMDGFIAENRWGVKATKIPCSKPTANPMCGALHSAQAVMEYHDGREIPNYWAYANNFVLQDHMFEPVGSWSLPSHLALVSGWSAVCENSDPLSCASDINIWSSKRNNKYAWTEIAYLFKTYNVSWAYYLDEGRVPNCKEDDDDCADLKTLVPSIWNPLPQFADIHETGQARQTVFKC